MSTAYFNTQDVAYVDSVTIKRLQQHAINSKLGHYRYCLHHDNYAPIQEMVIALSKNALFPPHKHPRQKSESIHIISGELATFIFNDHGEVTQIIHLSSSGDKAKLQRIEGGTWHLPICLSDTVVYHETLVGPYDKNSDVVIPDWVPNLDSEKSLTKFYDQLKLLL